MATKEKALQYAKDSATRQAKAYLIVQQKNGQWLFRPTHWPLSESEIPKSKWELVFPSKT